MSARKTSQHKAFDLSRFDKKPLSESLLRLRERHGGTWVALADSLGVPATSIRGWASPSVKKNRPTWSQALALSEFEARLGGLAAVEARDLDTRWLRESGRIGPDEDAPPRSLEPTSRVESPKSATQLILDDLDPKVLRELQAQLQVEDLRLAVAARLSQVWGQSHIHDWLKRDLGRGVVGFLTRWKKSETSRGLVSPEFDSFVELHLEPPADIRASWGDSRKQSELSLELFIERSNQFDERELEPVLKYFESKKSRFDPRRFRLYVSSVTVEQNAPTSGLKNNWPLLNDIWFWWSPGKYVEGRIVVECPALLRDLRFATLSSNVNRYDWVALLGEVDPELLADELQARHIAGRDSFDALDVKTCTDKAPSATAKAFGHYWDQKYGLNHGSAPQAPKEN